MTWSLRRSRYPWFAATLVAMAGLAAAVSHGSRPATDAGTGVVTRGELVQRVTIAGTARPNRRTVISPPYDGYVHKLFVDVGQKVRAGDPVVSITQSLRGTSEEVFPMRSPFEGTVVEVLRTEGEFVEHGLANPIVRIDDLTHTFIDANAPESEIGKLKVGQEALIRASAILGRTYHGRIEHISLAAKEQKDWDRQRVEFPVTLRVLDPDVDLKPGMSVILDVITRKLEHVLTLKHEFIQKDHEQYFVTTVRGERRKISVGQQNEEVFEIKQGLTEGDRVRLADFLAESAEESVD